jgi:hypothetical protein
VAEVGGLITGKLTRALAMNNKMKKILKTIYLYCVIMSLFTCNSPYSEKLFPMEQFLQGGWYKIGLKAFNSDTNNIYFDTNTTIEMLYFENHNLKQYERYNNYSELFLWSFLADSTYLYRKNDTIDINSQILIHNDTLLISVPNYMQYNIFLRYNSSSLPSSWPDSIVISSYKQ